MEAQFWHRKREEHEVKRKKIISKYINTSNEMEMSEFIETNQNTKHVFTNALFVN